MSEFDKYSAGKMRNQAIEYALPKMLNISVDIIKFVVRFIADGLKSVFGMR